MNDRLSHNRQLMPEEPWRKALLPLDSTLQQAIRCLDESGLQIAIVTAPDGHMMGALTDVTSAAACCAGSHWPAQWTASSTASPWSYRHSGAATWCCS